MKLDPQGLLFMYISHCKQNNLFIFRTQTFLQEGICEQETTAAYHYDDYITDIYWL